MDQGLHRAAVEVEVRWAGHPRAVRAALAYARNAVTRIRMLPGNPAIRKLARNAAQRWPEVEERQIR